jgi:hypothetical protein
VDLGLASLAFHIDVDGVVPAAGSLTAEQCRELIEESHPASLLPYLAETKCRESRASLFE